MDPPAPMTSRNLWDLAADLGGLKHAAKAWLDLGRAMRDSAASVTTAAGPVDEQWVGDAADSYYRHRVRLTDDLVESAGLDDGIAAALQSSVSALAGAQGRLANSLGLIAAKCPLEVSGVTVTFRPQDPADVVLVGREIGVATAIRASLDITLADVQGAIVAVLPALGKIAASWQSVAEGRKDPFRLPAEARGTATIVDATNDRFIINTGPGDDDIEVLMNPITGERTVVINGVSHPVPDGLAITVRAGEGNDTITVPPGIHIDLVLLGGEGNDTIVGGVTRERILGGGGDDSITAGGGNDRVSGGAGADYLDGQSGDDTLAGGTGIDIIYGLSGDDRISGGDGGDYLEGASGADTIDGGAGGDTISGSRGRDRISGGAANDKISGGSSADRVAGDQGNDRINGNSSNDSLSGNSGRDRINGGSGRDRISAGSGNDSISARDRTRDTINCGTGRDTVVADRIDRVSRNCERVRRR